MTAACLLGSATRRLRIFFACRWLPCDQSDIPRTMRQVSPSVFIYTSLQTPSGCCRGSALGAG